MGQRENKTQSKKGFIAVDVWQSHFGQVSVKAVYSIFAEVFKIKPEDRKKYTFSQCIDALRKLEDPTYETPKDQSIDQVE